MPAADRLVRLFTGTDPNETELIKSMLKRNNIECAIYGGLQERCAGVSRTGVTVWEKDFDRAKEILDQHQRTM